MGNEFALMNDGRSQTIFGRAVKPSGKNQNLYLPLHTPMGRPGLQEFRKILRPERGRQLTIPSLRVDGKDVW